MVALATTATMTMVEGGLAPPTGEALVGRLWLRTLCLRLDKRQAVNLPPFNLLSYGVARCLLWDDIYLPPEGGKSAYRPELELKLLQ